MKDSTISRLATGCGAGALLVAGLSVTTVAEAKVETCRGINATLVGTPGLPLAGTADRDVMVTNGASVVSALAGDDLICVTGGTPYVDAAAGGDTVDAVGSGGAAVTAYLGQGEDRFFGGPGADTVTTFGVAATNDDDADTVLTYGGNDVVVSGAPSQPNGDTIDLGDGDDAVDFKGSEALRAGAVAGGLGYDLVYFDLSGKGDWILNNTNGVGRRGDRNILNWTSMEKFDLIPTEGTFQFLGSDAAETLDISDPATLTPHGRASVSMGAGNDFVTIDPETAIGSVYDGGLGTNTFVATSPASTLSVDLTAGRFDVGDPSTFGEAAVVNFKNATLTATSATAKGSSDANRLLLRGCNLVGKGLKGKDYIEGSSGALACKPKARFVGGKGHDKVIGTSGKDVLIGGKGTDKADGRKNKDKCRAEKRKSCES
ncbi:MAG: hypothetical protein H0X12_10800 [Nocardioides sp.]|nr:hypothetical protein [Nocardioides sp.]